MVSQDKPVIEPPKGGQPEPDVTERALHQRIRQQEILAELGVLALQDADFHDLLNSTARLTAEGLGAEYCKILEYQRSSNTLLVIAGVGWEDGVVGKAVIGADEASPAGYALHTAKAVISNHLVDEQRFRTPELLLRHGIRRAMNVILQGDGSPFGVLEVDSSSEGEFGENDIAFLQGAANLLGMAIEQQRNQAHLKAALERYEVLLREVNHRVKNSLQLVTSMLHLQTKAVADPVLGEHLNEASNRISAVAHAYERLAYDGDHGAVDLITYIREVLDDLAHTVAPNKIQFVAPDAIQISGDRAILVALIVNELVSNSGKYAYPDTPGGPISIELARAEDNAIRLTVSDEGVGLPPDYVPSKSRRLGSRLISVFTKQLGAEMSTAAPAKGARFSMLVPADRAGAS